LCPTTCPLDSTCKKYRYKFKCICDPGYILSNNVCPDYDECVNNQHNCHSNAFCTNNKGSFNCTCNIGYIGNGTHCRLDSCPSWKVCPPRSSCKQDVGCVCNANHTLIFGTCYADKIQPNILPQNPSVASNNISPGTSAEVYTVVYAIFGALVGLCVLTFVAAMLKDKLRKAVTSVAPSRSATPRPFERLKDTAS